MADNFKDLDADVSVVEIKGDVMKHLNYLISSYTRAPIEAALTITGHTYWVVLEYGSAPAQQGSRRPSSGDPYVVAIPDWVPGPRNPSTHEYVDKNGRTQSGKWYPIKARYKRQLHFIDRSGRQRHQEMVHHPGIKARGFLRRAIRAWAMRVEHDLEYLQQQLEDELPERKTLVKLINFQMRNLLQEIKDATPIGEDADGERFDDEDGSHLKDAWGIVPAK